MSRCRARGEVTTTETHLSELLLPWRLRAVPRKLLQGLQGLVALDLLQKLLQHRQLHDFMPGGVAGVSHGVCFGGDERERQAESRRGNPVTRAGGCDLDGGRLETRKGRPRRVASVSDDDFLSSKYRFFSTRPNSANKVVSPRPPVLDAPAARRVRRRRRRCPRSRVEPGARTDRVWRYNWRRNVRPGVESAASAYASGGVLRPCAIFGVAIVVATTRAECPPDRRPRFRPRNVGV